MDFDIPSMKANMVVTTPYDNIPGIQPNKKYVIFKVSGDKVWIRNDKDIVQEYDSIDFIEADLYFALSLYMTFMRLLNLTNMPLKSTKK